MPYFLNSENQERGKSEFHGIGNTKTFKTRTQELGFAEELIHFTNCVLGKEKLLVSYEEIFATMETIFAIERSLATAKAVNNEKF